MLSLEDQNNKLSTTDHLGNTNKKSGSRNNGFSNFDNRSVLEIFLDYIKEFLKFLFRSKYQRKLAKEQQIAAIREHLINTYGLEEGLKRFKAYEDSLKKKIRNHKKFWVVIITVITNYLIGIFILPLFSWSLAINCPGIVYFSPPDLPLPFNLVRGTLKPEQAWLVSNLTMLGIMILSLCLILILFIRINKSKRYR